MIMEGGVRSGGVLKKKSSSGCLIIKKKGGDRNSGGRLGGFSDDSKERKRARLAASFSDSGGEEEPLEFMRRRVNGKRLSNGSVGCKRDKVLNREYGMDNSGTVNSSHIKKSRLDLFDFDEYDEYDEKMMRNEYLEDSKVTGQSGGGIMKGLGASSSNGNSVVGKRKQESYIGASSIVKRKGIEHSGMKGKGLELQEEDEANMPISFLRLKHQRDGDQPIRLQGKNGVLKVMLNKKKKSDFSSHPNCYNDSNNKERKISISDGDVDKEVLAHSPHYPSTGPPENHGLSVDKEKIVEQKKARFEKEKSGLNKGNKTSDSEIAGSDMLLKLETPSAQCNNTKKAMKKDKQRSPVLENISPIKGKEAKEGKTMRGGSTEKQILREKIREMLIEAGWKIDYRPRRNRDYLDAVYINPGGTAYWSIIKAYDAFKKQLEDDNDKSGADVACPSLAPLSEDLISKLTRQTKKKIQEGLKRKRKEDGMTKSAKKSVTREGTDSSDSDSNDDLAKRKPGIARIGKPSNSKGNVIQGRTSKLMGRCTLLVRGSDKGGNSDADGYVRYRGKRTVLAWLIDRGSAKLSEKVQYMNRRRARVMLEGWLTRDGIHCGCCSKILTVSKFELHAGSKLRHPFQNIFLESGLSLLQCQVDAWNSQEESARRDFHFVDVDGDDPDDDTCGICGDGGDLVCCDSCPSTFHQLCLEIQMLPSGDWHCPNCTCKFCHSAVAEEDEAVSNKNNRCSFCEKKYHKACCEKVGAPSVSSNGASFCGLRCLQLYDHIQKILGVKHELEAGFSWSLIQRTDVSDASQRGFAQRVESNSKLAVALSVMDECFLPIIDRRSGINIIHNVAYNCGSNFNRLNYRRFYTVILERGDEIIAAASIRLHGTQLAEMPFIGTREMYRRQGMCRRLLSAIENELSSLRVEKLVIPAISEHLNTWTAVFGFHKFEDVNKKEIKSMNMLVFPGTDMLLKPLMKQDHSNGMKISESTDDQPFSVEQYEVDPPVEQSRQVSSDFGRCHDSKSKKEDDALDHGSPTLATPSKDHKAAGVAVCSSEKLPATHGNTNVEIVVEKEQKESTACAESYASTTMSHKLLRHPAEENIDSSAEDLVCHQTKSEEPCLESNSEPSGEEALKVAAPKAVNVAEPQATGILDHSTLETSNPASLKVKEGGELMNISEDASPHNNMENSSIIGSLPDSALEMPSQSTADKINGETIVNEKPVQRPAPISEAQCHPSEDYTPTMDANSIPDDTASHSKENSNLDGDSLEDATFCDILNPTSTRESIATSNFDLDHKSVDEVKSNPEVVEAVDPTATATDDKPNRGQ